MLDIFNGDAFTVISLTDAINKLKFVPGRINQLGIFQETSVATTVVAIEEKNNTLQLVAPTPRGGPGVTLDRARRVMRTLPVPHFEINDGVMAESVQNLRPFGQESGLETVQALLAQVLQAHSQSMEATLEYSRVGAMKGIVTYADGSTLNLFTEFGVTQLPELAFDLTNATPVAGAFRGAIAGAWRTIAVALDGVPFSGLYAICGDAFFDAMIAHVEVRNTYLNQQEASELRTGYISTGGLSFGTFTFGGVTWENYRGAVGGTQFVETDKCYIVPLVPGLFRTVYAPADYWETVNTLGRRMYAKQFPMPNDKGRHLDTQTNALNYCARPGVIQKGKLGA